MARPDCADPVTGAWPPFFGPFSLPSFCRADDVRGVLSLKASNHKQPTFCPPLPQVPPNHRLRPEKNSRARAPIPQKDLLISRNAILCLCVSNPEHTYTLSAAVLQADWDRASFCLRPKLSVYFCSDTSLPTKTVATETVESLVRTSPSQPSTPPQTTWLPTGAV